MPGISPRLANSRKQILHILKSRIYPRLREHRKQRRTIRVENFGFFAARAVTDFLAIYRTHLTNPTPSRCCWFLTSARRDEESGAKAPSTRSNKVDGQKPAQPEGIWRISASAASLLLGVPQGVHLRRRSLHMSEMCSYRDGWGF